MNSMNNCLLSKFEEVLRDFIDTRTDRINNANAEVTSRFNNDQILTTESDRTYINLKSNISKELLPILVNYANIQSDIKAITSYSCYRQGLLEGILITCNLMAH